MIPCLLILAVPDFGSAVLTGAVCIAVLMALGTRLLYLIPAGLAALPVLYHLVMGEPYRARRILAFLNPEADPLGAGYQIIQSTIAIGSGRLTGLGAGAGMQKAGASRSGSRWRWASPCSWVCKPPCTLRS